MKVLAFAASSSRQSINKQLVTSVVNSIDRDKHQTEILDLNDYELPLFSQDKEAELGQPALAQEFRAKILRSDAIIISFAEHNGSYTAAYKNIFDWVSRIDPKVYAQKNMLLLATSPGAGGASNVLAAATASVPHFGGIVSNSISLARFYDNFDVKKQLITLEDVNLKIKSAVQQLLLS